MFLLISIGPVRGQGQVGPGAGGGGDGHVGVSVVVGGDLPVCRDIRVNIGPGDFLHGPRQRGPRPLQPPGRMRSGGQGALGAAEDGALQLLLEAGVCVTQVAGGGKLGMMLQLGRFWRRRRLGQPGLVYIRRLMGADNTGGLTDLGSLAPGPLRVRGRYLADHWGMDTGILGILDIPPTSASRIQRIVHSLWCARSSLL